MDKVVFKINGKEYKVGSEVSSDTMLLDYIREFLQLRATKYMCREAGCGACIVSARRPSKPRYSINSCMVPIAACHGLEITTIEYLGNRKIGYHILQTTLGENNGTQCGYCSPGWVMAMYSLLNKKPTMLEIEQSLSSNVCRCTGYRPILEAFKKFGVDAPESLKIKDIEDLDICHKFGKPCKESCSVNDDGWCVVEKDEVKIIIKLKDDKFWYRVDKVDDIFDILNDKGDDSYMLVGGNTAKGAYPIEGYPRVLIDINGVLELKGYKFDQNLMVGSGVTLSELLDICEIAADTEYFDYLQTIHDHLKKVAHLPVRNIGTIAGNLMIKHQHNFFPSDVFLLLQTVGAQLTLVRSQRITQTVTMQQFLKSNMKGVVILNVLFPPLSDDKNFVTFKIMPRRLNAHAILNAGFLFQISNDVVRRSRIVFGGLSPSFNRAYKTEEYMIGKNLFTNKTLQSTLKVLNKELVVTEELPEPSAEYRRKTALALFYKALLRLCPQNRIQDSFRSGAISLHDSRPVSQARQIYEADPRSCHLFQAISKIDVLHQCSGEAFYADDVPSLPCEVFAEFTLTTVGSGDIVSINPEEALKQQGVLAFYSAKDIPGLNSFMPDNNVYPTVNALEPDSFNADINQVPIEEVFCSKSVKYYNQPFGVIVAETRAIAERAANLVKVRYENIKKPVTDIKDAIEDPRRLGFYKSVKASDIGKDVEKVITGSNKICGQYHYAMENMACVMYLIEEGIQVWTSTHYLDGVHVMMSKALKIDQNRIHVHVRRVGGSYGLKLTRNIQSAIACGLVVLKLNRPCRFIQSLTTTTRVSGKKIPCLTNFDVQVNKSGQIQYLNCTFYQDYGHTVSENIISDLLVANYSNCYDKSRWDIEFYNTISDTTKNTWFRAPGNFDSISNAELIMERISYELMLDPITVRLNNLDKVIYSDIEDMYETLKNNASYNERRFTVNQFNKKNRWKKRGLRFSFFRWNHESIGNFNTLVSVYQGDGTVLITHGGVKMGQGINTKAAQICAYCLKIPIEKIQIQGSDTITAPNSYQAAGSLTSQNLSIAIQKCCNIILKRLEPIKALMPLASWEQTIRAAYEAGIDLQAQSHINSKDLEPYLRDVFGVSLAEVEIDVLTGEFEILRVDLLEDAGKSVSPLIDIGQIEGAFIMGVGYWTSEKLIYATTGELLNNRTWNYHIPLCTDIPQDFRVYLRKKSYSCDCIFGSKAIGEPPICMSVCVALAIREAISEARYESGIPKNQWFSIDGPSSVDMVALSTETKITDYKFY